jgi:hypothetical protein
MEGITEEKIKESRKAHIIKDKLNIQMKPHRKQTQIGTQIIFNTK